jgi:acyl-coenzyme A synthetase/AMP-(fatty) acid ligase/acyl carrier protein
MNYIHYLVNEFELHPGERVLQLTSLAFDPSFRDTLGVLTFGGTVILMDDEQMRDPAFIASAIVEQKVNCILSIVPTMFRALTTSINKDTPQHNQLRLLMPSGEVLLPEDVDSVRKNYGAGVKIVNQYGPTECSMISTMYPVPDSGSWATPEILIGKPIANVRLYILDPQRNLVPDGVNGELYIGGVGVSPGYLNQPELTSERIFPDPFGDEGNVYRTGDIVRRNSNGELIFLGRTDHQIKLRGYRIELEEIEAVIHQYPNIREAIVVPSRQGEIEKLTAFITLAGTELYFSTQDLLQFLRGRLPFYMLPSGIVLLPQMPLTPTGKIDRRGFPLVNSHQDEPHSEAPSNKIEARLVTIWQEVIGIDHVGIRDNFFQLGGHSLMAVLLFTRIQEEFGVTVPIHLIFTDSTVEALADYLSEQSPPKGKVTSAS